MNIMGRNWNGFAAQNEIIKLQWAALEANEVQAAQRALELLLGGDDEEAGQEPEEEAGVRKPDWLEP
jgi:hypothetical protein